MKVCGLDRLPDRRTFDRRFRIISFDIKARIDAMGILFVKARLVDTYSVSVDSSLLRAKGHVWHRSSMRKNVVPYSGIDTDARWGYSKTKGWVFGYKLHLASSAGALIVPLSADFTTANIPDNKMYESITSSIPEGIRYVAADEGYDDHELYDFSRYRGLQLVCPIKRYRHTKYRKA
jgi:Transposase DDE domain.